MGAEQSTFLKIMSGKSTIDLIQRLRGIYNIPVQDGCGPLNGSDTFTREFYVPPISLEAAECIEQMQKVIDAARCICQQHDTGKDSTLANEELRQVLRDFDTPPLSPQTNKQS